MAVSNIIAASAGLIKTFERHMRMPLQVSPFIKGKLLHRSRPAPDNYGQTAEMISASRIRLKILEHKMATALIVIDVQNDYFPGGKFPLWNPESAEANCLRLIGWAKSASVPVVLVQHVVEGTPAPFFAAGSAGAEIHPPIRAATPETPVIVKAFADSFEKTELKSKLDRLGVDRLVICGMMTHNCVTHTAISKAAEAYEVTVVGDACATVSEIVHILALHALSTRVKVVDTDELISKDQR